MRKEIEVKAKVIDLKKLEQSLQDLGCVLSDPIRQEDEVYYSVEPKFPFAYAGAGVQILRIRRQDGNKVILTFKESLSGGLDCIEYETEISDPDEMKKILLMIGYEVIAEVKKIRRKANYGEYEICLDEVDELGSFIEVEQITEEEDSDTIQNELFEFLMKLGVAKEDRVTEGYDTMMYLLKR